MQPERVVIIANGDLENHDYYRDFFTAGDFILCVNGGTRHALALGLKPDIIIGDLDSMHPADRESIRQINPRLIKFPSEKDKSDLELAVDHVIKMQPAEIVVIGALGGKRTDHAFINLLLLQLPLRHGIPASIVDKDQEIRLTDRDIVVEGGKGDYLSLFALTPEVSGIKTEGLKYPLKEETLYFASTRGLSNEITSSAVKITFKSGLLLLIKTYRESISS